MVTEYDVPTPSSSPDSIAAGGRWLWFTEETTNKVGRVSVSGSMTEFATPTLDSYPAGIVAGPDRAMWFTEYGANAVGRLAS